MNIDQNKPCLPTDNKFQKHLIPRVYISHMKLSNMKYYYIIIVSSVYLCGCLECLNQNVCWAYHCLFYVHYTFVYVHKIHLCQLYASLKPEDMHEFYEHAKIPLA